MQMSSFTYFTEICLFKSIAHDDISLPAVCERILKAPPFHRLNKRFAGTERGADLPHRYTDRVARPSARPREREVSYPFGRVKRQAVIWQAG